MQRLTGRIVATGGIKFSIGTTVIPGASVPNFQSKGELITVICAILGVIQPLFGGVVRQTLMVLLLVLAALALLNLFFGFFPQFTWSSLKESRATRGGLERVRRGPRPVSVRSVEIEDGKGYTDAKTKEPLKWPMKIRVVLHNDSADRIDVGGPDWIAGIEGAQLQIHPSEGVGYKYQVEQIPGGAAQNKWQAEAKTISVPPDTFFRFWIGASSQYNKPQLDNMRNAKTLATLVLPITTADEKLTLYEFSI